MRESILHPSAKIVAGYRDIMPTFEGQISEEEVIALIAFIQSLQAGQTPRRVEDLSAARCNAAHQPGERRTMTTDLGSPTTVRRFRPSGPAGATPISMSRAGSLRGC